MMSILPMVTSGDSGHGQERQNLLTNLLESVKSCQIKFGGRKELATESDNTVSVLCRNWEEIFTHGLRIKPLSKNSSTLQQVSGMVAHTFKPSQEPPCFWHFVRLCLTRHELDRYLSLKNVWTDVGRGRAWLRSSLNERSLERYLLTLLSNKETALNYYHEWALIFDEELNSTLPNMAAGLAAILFAVSIDEGRLNKTISSTNSSQNLKSEPVSAVHVEEPHHPRRRKKGPANIVSFDSDPGTTPPSPCVLPTSVYSTHIAVSTTEDASRVFCEAESAVPIINNSPSPSSNDSSLHDFENISKQAENKETVSTLTPVNDGNVGELMLISMDNLPADDVSIGESEDVTIEALLARRANNELTTTELEQLFTSLEQSQEANAGLRTKLKNIVARHRTETANTENRLNTLSRENEVLKHQLRKYVSAVQMLNRDGAAHEALAYVEASQQAAAQREEAAKYQEQLIEVAQMHGELMEFNDRLQKLLLGREEVISRLERELTDLRGPLPPGTVWESDTSTPTPDALVNIWIPSAFLTGGASNVHHLYQVYIRIRDTEWNVYRRYAQFHSLHSLLKKKFPLVATLDFPPKKTIGNKDAKFVEERRVRLQRYLRQAVDIVSRAMSDLADPDGLILVIPFFSQSFSDDEKKLKGAKASKRRGRSDLLTAAQYNGL